MIITHIESGLGNQMLDFADYIVLKYFNEKQEFFIENLIYELGESQNSINMWNGYELENIFGVRPRNIKELFSPEEWSHILEFVRKSNFWNNNWNYSKPIVQVLNNHGMELIDLNPRKSSSEISSLHFVKHKFKVFLMNTRFGYFIYRAKHKKRKVRIYAFNHKLLDNINYFAGHYLNFHYIGQSNEEIDRIVFKTFVFPKLTDEKNIKLSELIKTTNSISIHLRLDDARHYNMKHVTYGYYKRAVDYIRKRVSNPVFILFGSKKAIEYMQENPSMFGLFLESDEIVFVDWNVGSQSYIDMSLMSICKHNIIGDSTFGWWGTFLNNYTNKIAISPNPRFRNTIFL